MAPAAPPAPPGGGGATLDTVTNQVTGLHQLCATSDGYLVGSHCQFGEHDLQYTKCRPEHIYNFVFIHRTHGRAVPTECKQVAVDLGLDTNIQILEEVLDLHTGRLCFHICTSHIISIYVKDHIHSAQVCNLHETSVCVDLLHRCRAGLVALQRMEDKRFNELLYAPSLRFIHGFSACIWAGGLPAL